MKIGVNTLFLIPGQVGGSETYLMEILQHWKGQADLGHEWVLFTQQDNHAWLTEAFAGDGWTCEQLDFSAENRVVRILREQTELPRRVKQSGVDVLWSPGYTAPFRTTCPQVVSILDMQYKRFPEDLSFVARWVTGMLVQTACRRADALLTISEFSKREMLELTRAKPEKVTVTPLAADRAFSEKVSAHLPVEGSFVLCVANSYPHKNVDQLVRAFALLEDEVSHQLVWVGRPRLGEAKVEEALGALKDPSRVVRLSGMSREELIGLYQAADVFVFPSLYEGFGLPVLEAMLAGTPVLTTNCGSLPEVGGEVAEVYDTQSDSALADALRAMLKRSPEERERRIDAARNWAEGFTWRKAADLTLATLASSAKELTD